MRSPPPQLSAKDNPIRIYPKILCRVLMSLLQTNTLLRPTPLRHLRQSPLTKIDIPLGNMVFVGLLFCDDCGNLLPRENKARAPQITCDLCQTLNKSLCAFSSAEGRVLISCTDEWPDHQTTASRPESFPSSLRNRLHSNTIEVSQDVANSQQIANEECPKCHNPQMRFSEAQLRSADEGSTIFYTCPRCDFKFNTNN